MKQNFFYFLLLLSFSNNIQGNYSQKARNNRGDYPYSISPSTEKQNRNSNRSSAYNNSNLTPTPRSLPHKLQNCPAEVLMHIFTNEYGWSENIIFEQYEFYFHDEFIKLLKTFSNYEKTITHFHNDYTSRNCLYKKLYSPWGKRIAVLYKEIQDNKKAAILEKERKDNAIKEAAARKHNEYMQTISHIKSHRFYADLREEALTQTRANSNKKDDHTFSISHQAFACAKELDITEKHLLSGCMNKYEAHMQTEFIEQIEKMACLKKSFTITLGENIFYDSIAYGVTNGLHANQSSEPAATTLWADFGWEMLEVFKGAMDSPVQYLHNQKHFFGQLAEHPLETATELIHGINILIKSLAQLTGTFIESSVYDYLTWHDMANETRQKGYAPIKKLILECENKLNGMSTREKSKHFFALIIDLIFTKRICATSLKLCSKAQPLLIEAISELRHNPKAQLAILGAEQITCHASEAIKSGASKAAKVIKSIPATAKTIPAIVHELLPAGYLATFETEIAALKRMFDGSRKGFGMFAKKYIKPDYEHIFGITFKAKNNIIQKAYGFHHDLISTIENNTALKLVGKKMYPHGFYKVSAIKYNGSKIKDIATFFPTNWSREKVMHKIYAAYDHFIESGTITKLTKEGKMRIRGLISEGIEIEMILTQKGKLITAYPILN